MDAVLDIPLCLFCFQIMILASYSATGEILLWTYNEPLLVNSLHSIRELQRIHNVYVHHA